MDIIVALKQVPDVGAGIAINDEGTDLARDRLGFVTNPFDEWALEEALLLKDMTDGWVTVVALDDPGIDHALYRALALGADHAVKLVASAEAAPAVLYRASDGFEAQEFKRTASRLIEMGSRAYLALPHGHKDSAASGSTEGIVET